MEQTEENLKEFAVAKRVIIKYRRVLVFHLKSNSSLYKSGSNELIFSFFKIFAKAKHLNCSWFVAHLQKHSNIYAPLLHPKHNSDFS